MPTSPSPLSSRSRALSSQSSSGVSDERDSDKSIRRATLPTVLKVVTPDRCRGCTRRFTKMLTIKQCFRCKHHVCALCVFKVPMFHGEKGKLPKHALHARLCAVCYDASITLCDGSASQPEMSPPSGRQPSGTYDDDCDDDCDCDTSAGPATTVLVPVETPSKASLWLSLVTGSLMLGVVVFEHHDVTVRLAAVLVLYIAFVVIHPVWHTSPLPSASSTITPAPGKVRLTRASTTSVSDDSDKEADVDMDAVVLARQASLQARWRDLQTSTDWVKNEAKSTATITLSELDCGEDLPTCIKVEAFVPLVTPDEMLAFFSNPDPAARAKWDSHMALHTVVQDDVALADGRTGRLVHNVQKSHGMGLVSSRDFVLLAFRMTDATFVQGSVEDARVPVRAGSTRGHLHILGFELTPVDGGCHMVYVNHVDIKGSLPRKLVTGGTCDNMVKFMTAAVQAKKKWL